MRYFGAKFQKKIPKQGVSNLLTKYILQMVVLSAFKNHPVPEDIRRVNIKTWHKSLLLTGQPYRITDPVIHALLIQNLITEIRKRFLGFLLHQINDAGAHKHPSGQEKTAHNRR